MADVPSSQVSLRDLIHMGLAVGASFQLSHVSELAEMSMAWPAPAFALNLAWRLAIPPLAFVVCALAVRGGCRL